MKSKVDFLIEHTVRSSGPAPVVKIHASDVSGSDERRHKNAINLAAFKKLLPKLLKTDSGKFVAFFDGQLVAKNVDRFELLESLPQKLRPASSLLIRQVVKNQKPDLIILNRPI